MKKIAYGWFAKHFLPEKKKFCAEKNLDFRILLILDASAHMLHKVSVHDNIKKSSTGC
jgi:hypothetical protein